MPTTTAQLGIPIPNDADPVADDALAIRNLGNNLDGRIKFGQAAVTPAASSSGSVAVVFATAFTGAGVPRIVCSCSNSNVWLATPSAITNNGFTVNVRHVDNTAGSPNLTVDWHALK